MDTVSNPVTPRLLFCAIRPRCSVGNMGFLDIEGLVRDTSKYILIQIHGASTAPHGDIAATNLRPVIKFLLNT